MGFFILSLLIFFTPTWVRAEEPCLIVRKKASAIRGKKGKRVRKTIYKGQKLPDLGDHSSGRFIKTKIDRYRFWVKASSVERLSGDACLSFNENQADKKGEGDPFWEEPKPEKKKTVKKKKAQAWVYGVEAGYQFSVSAQHMENIITEVPASNVDVNDDDYDSPFVDSVSGDSGYELSAFVEMPLFSWLRLKSLFGYSQKTLSYVTRLNPNNTDQSFVTYDQLTPSNNRVSFRSVHFTLMPKYRFHIFSLPLDVGLGVRIHYYLDQFVVEFRTAPSKLTAYDVRSGYSEVEMDLLPRLELHIEPLYIYAQFNNRLSGSDFSMDPQVGLGLQF